MVSLFEFVYEEIGYLRKKMYEKESQVNRLCDPKLLKLSERLDEKLNNFQRLLQLASPGGIGQMLLSHEQLILKHQNKNMPYEYNVFKTFANFCKTTLDNVQKRSDISAESMDNDIKHFLASIHEADDCLLNKFVLTYEGCILSEQEAKKFIAFIRAEIC
jgi:hypothetical protein